MIRTKAFIVALALLAAWGTASAQSPQEALSIDVNGWRGGAQVRPDNVFSHCLAAREYEEGRRLGFLISGRGEINIAVVNPAWSLSEGEAPETTVAVDGAAPRPVETAAGRADLMIMRAGPDRELFDRLKRGNVLSIKSAAGDLEFPLTGSFAALDALARCVDAARTITAEGTPPGPAADAPGGRPMSQDAVRETLQLAGLKDVEFLPPDEVPADDLALSHVWRIGPMLGGLHQEQRAEDEIRIDAITDRYVTLLKDRCPGEFTVDSQPAEPLLEVFAIKTAAVQCTSAEPENSGYVSLFVALDQFHYSVFMHQTGLADKAVADEVSRGLADTIRALAAQQAGEGEGSAPPPEAAAPAEAPPTPQAEPAPQAPPPVGEPGTLDLTPPPPQ